MTCLSRAKQSLSNRGFSMLELIIVVAIMAIMAAVIVSGFSRYAKGQQFKTETGLAAEDMVGQRSRSLAGINNSVHGFVVASSTSIILFEGQSYTPGDPSNDEVVLFSSLATSSLSNGATTVYFDNFTGTSSATGTISLYSTLLGVTTTITIYESGAIEY